MDNVLEVRNLRKNYSRFELQDVSFTVPEGCGKQRCRQDNHHPRHLKSDT